MEEIEIIPFLEVSAADLQVDAVYQGGRRGNAGDDPLPSMLNVSAGGGFRYRGSLDELKLVVLTSSRQDPDWPDRIDLETGIYTYYGDNKRPGQKLHGTSRRGNKLLRRIFELANSGVQGRQQVPPILIFANTSEWRDVVFLGLAVPGTTDLRASEDLVAIWRISKGRRFQNYRARFAILNVQLLPRAWIKDIIGGNPLSSNAPRVWSNWVKTGQTRPLIAARSIEHRGKVEQLPQNPRERSVIKTIYNYFQPKPHEFERCAAALAESLLPEIFSIDLTRPSRDGGRDAIGQLRIGSGESSILVDFSLEAKCYNLSTGVSVRDMSRLISRLRHRQFGILVTTSYVNTQAYREIKEDQHPIIVIAATDIVELLRDNNCASPASVKVWLEREFPLT